MNLNTIGILCIVTGVLYGSLAFDRVNRLTIGFLVNNHWVKPPVPDQDNDDWLGPKPTILLYSGILVALGIYMLIAPK